MFGQTVYGEEGDFKWLELTWMVMGSTGNMGYLGADDEMLSYGLTIQWVISLGATMNMLLMKL